MPFTYRNNRSRTPRAHVRFGRVTPAGEPQAVVCADDRFVYAGATAEGTPIASYEDGRVYAGLTHTEPPIAAIAGRRIFAGPRPTGQPIAFSDSPLPIDLAAAAVYHVLATPRQTGRDAASTTRGAGRPRAEARPRAVDTRRRLADAVLVTLGGRLPRRSREALAASVAKPLADSLLGGDSQAQRGPLTMTELVAEVSGRIGASPAATQRGVEAALRQLGRALGLRALARLGPALTLGIAEHLVAQPRAA